MTSTRPPMLAADHLRELTQHHYAEEGLALGFGIAFTTPLRSTDVARAA